MKKLVDDLSLDKDVLQAVIPKSRWVCSATIGSAALCRASSSPVSGTSGVVGGARIDCNYRRRQDDYKLRKRPQDLMRGHIRFGHRRLHGLLGCEQIAANDEMIQSVYCGLELSLKRSRYKRLTNALQPRRMLTAHGRQWLADSPRGVTASGRQQHVFTVLDSFSEQSQALEVNTSLPSRRITHVLDKAVEKCGNPYTIRGDGGPRISRHQILASAARNKINVVHVEFSEPTENAYIKSFHGRFHCEYLNTIWFWPRLDAWRKIEGRLSVCSSAQRLSALAYRTPYKLAQQWHLAFGKRNRAMDQLGQGRLEKLCSGLYPAAPEPNNSFQKFERFRS